MKIFSGKGILFYDFLSNRGGAENVTIDILRALPGLDLCVDFCLEEYREELAELDVNVIELGTKTTLVGWQTLKGLFDFYFRNAPSKDYDWALYTGSNAPVAIRHRNSEWKVLYCYTIPRFAYDLEGYWMSEARWWQVPLLKFLIFVVRRLYEQAFNQMDVVLADSKNVQDRIKKYLDRDSIILYPPCNVDDYHFIGQGDYYLSLARVEPFKRVRLIVETFIEMPNKQLVVASGGRELGELKRLAKNATNIRFTGWLDQELLVGLMGNAIATIYIPIDEDFGMSPVESMAAGKPVIGVSEGGLLETIVDGQTGLLVKSGPEAGDLIAAVNELTADKALSMRPACEKRAQKFGKRIFMEQLQAHLEPNRKEVS